jgi:hypothetical protein
LAASPADAAAGLGQDPALDPADRVDRASEERLGAGEIHEGLVDGDGLHERREVGEDRHHLDRHPLVFLHVHRQERPLRAEPRGAPDRHRRAHAELSGFVRRSGHDTAARGARADDHRRPRSSGRSRCSIAA